MSLTRPPGLPIALLFNHERQVVYLPGSAVNCALAGYGGQGKPDARDARCG
ncbi:hypothetical protein GCM10009678_82770 [Actinomadura kijaniata]